jgi:hypothetical protein
MIDVFDKEGNKLTVHNVDARELIKSGDYSVINPITKEGPIVETIIGKYEGDVDLEKLSVSELKEYALEKFKVKLNPRWGEMRCISEIKKLISMNETEEEEEDE